MFFGSGFSFSYKSQQVSSIFCSSALLFGELPFQQDFHMAWVRSKNCDALRTQEGSL
jgi:hypothetical protein